MTIESGALEQAYAKAEGSYGTLATPSSTDAIRHLELALQYKMNRERSPQKRGTPDHASSLPRRITAGFDLSSALWEPSGTLGTASYFGPLLKAAFGTQTTPNLATTAASSASTTGVTLTSGSGLAVGDTAIVTVGTGARREATRLKSVAGAAVTFDALSAAPDVPGAFVSGVNYKFATTLAESLSIFLFHTGGGYKEAVQGAIVDKVEFVFDGTKEATIKFSGPAKTRVRTGFSQPGAHTTVGSPIGGLVGNFYLDGTAFLISNLTVTLSNGEELRNNELGTSTASGHMRGAARRTVEASCAFYLEDTTVIANAEAVTRNVIRAVVGNTNGSMLAAVLPAVEWEVPDTPTSDGPKIVTASGIAYASSAGNDSLFIGEH